MASRPKSLRNQSLTVRATGLAIITLAVFAIVGPVAGHLGGSTGLAAAAVAAAVCLAGAALALLASHFFAEPNLALAALMTGMTARMAIPLACGLAVHLRGGPLAEAGLLYYLVVFYPVTLAAETVLSLPPIQSSEDDGPLTAKSRTCRQ